MSAKKKVDQQGVEFKPKSGKKKTTAQYLGEVNTNPEKFGTTASHVSKVNTMITNADKTLRLNETRTKTGDKPREMKVGLIVRANGRLGVITDINDVITVKFPTGTKTSYPTNKVTFCRDQEKAKTQHQNLIDRRNK